MHLSAVTAGWIFQLNFFLPKHAVGKIFYAFLSMLIDGFSSKTAKICFFKKN